MDNDFTLDLRCTNCGRHAGKAIVRPDNAQAGERIHSFLAAYRCGRCWVAMQQDRRDRAAVQNPDPEPDGHVFGRNPERTQRPLFDDFAPAYGYAPGARRR